MVYPSVYEVVVPGARITDHQVHGHGNHHLFLTGVQVTADWAGDPGHSYQTYF